MGNRAVIQFKENPDLGIYLHWNGGRDSIEPFLDYARLKGTVNGDVGYQHARLCQIIGNFIGGNSSIGTIVGADAIKGWGTNADNGVYVVDKNYDIVDRVLPYSDFVEQHEYDHDQFLEDIDSTQPESEKLGITNLNNAEDVSPEDLNIGDTILVADHFSGIYKECTVLGFGEEGQVRNGRDIGGVPFTDALKVHDKYGFSANKSDKELAENVNSYVFDKKIKRVHNINEQIPEKVVPLKETIKVYDINWNADERIKQAMPSCFCISVEDIPKEIIEDYTNNKRTNLLDNFVGNYISRLTGFSHEGFSTNYDLQTKKLNTKSNIKDSIKPDKSTTKSTPSKDAR